MNIAIEYVLRNGRVQNLLTLPCSLFLENNEKKKKDGLHNKLVVTLSPVYGNGSVIVRHWDLWKTVKSEMQQPPFLPPFKESIIPVAEIFQHSDVIVKGFHLLEFHEEPYINAAKQYADLPHSAIQEKEYWDCLDNFFQPKIMRRLREDWLWIAFEKVYVDGQVRAKYDSNKASRQQEMVQHYAKPTWKIWQHWKERLLDFPGPATELVFAQAYNSKFLKIELKEDDPTTRMQRRSWDAPPGFPMNDENVGQFIYGSG